MATEVYQDSYYARQRIGSRASASVILPIVFDLIKPQAFVDVGCGVGTWLSVAGDLGVATLVGLEGAWVKDVAIEPGTFTVKVCELDRHLELPPDLPARYDLALCTEVAEHLPEERATSLVDDLCALSDVVLFSGAIPGQGGSGHINEQWQDYWANKFRALDFYPYDVVRPKVWNDAAVEVWYRQNMLLYVSKQLAGTMKGLQPSEMLNVMHPELYGWKHPPGIRYLLGELPLAIRRLANRRLGRAA
ncbi:class I SAM-dependent methyltransferase [Bradyrhizobium uaiense]|uniref:Class I SAM-dependent methyltransferase n=1 Tax=Bradyrhizobium uaiense TaxID=2594946 RepID=A0A6P1BUG4_9BRAD|nr:class I SAM-dependent methyltransferase [Bradyrhizobium uaiense]NEV01810.1 class I SAM-dependent methyltransferase [Bradyrhizobium uaiense]